MGIDGRAFGSFFKIAFAAIFFTALSMLGGIGYVVYLLLKHFGVIC